MTPQSTFAYRIIIRPDKRLGKSNQHCYSAHCPTLGLTDDGDTMEEALKNLHDTIAFHLESLQEEGKEIPLDHLEEEFVTNARIQLPISEHLLTTA